MTTEEKRKAIWKNCSESDINCSHCSLSSTSQEKFCAKYNHTNAPDEIIDKWYSALFPEPTSIKDSGERREFATGAVRDIQEGKGRCDLMPLDVVSNLTNNHVLRYIGAFQFHNDILYLELALKEFVMNYTNWCTDGKYPSTGIANMLLEVSKHFEEGAKKYNENNWKLGINTKHYIDSAVRHYLKWLRGDHDEPHDRAFCWNILCCIWTCKHKPELNDYSTEERR